MKVKVVNPDEEQGQQAAAAGPAAPEAVDEQPEAEVEAEVVEATPVEDADGQEDADEQEDQTDPITSDDEVFSLEDLEKARKAAKDAEDRYMRLEAEWDNFRKRTAREREQERQCAAESLVTKLLPVMDDIERALDHAETSQPEGAFAQFVDGIDAVHTKFAGVLEKTGVQVIDPAGQPFDANEHRSVGFVDDPDVFDETVRDVYQKGYRMGKRVLREAMVTVTKGGPRRPAETAEGAPADTQAGK